MCEGGVGRLESSLRSDASPSSTQAVAPGEGYSPIPWSPTLTRGEERPWVLDPGIRQLGYVGQTWTEGVEKGKAELRPRWVGLGVRNAASGFGSGRAQRTGAGSSCQWPHTAPGRPLLLPRGHELTIRLDHDQLFTGPSVLMLWVHCTVVCQHAWPPCALSDFTVSQIHQLEPPSPPQSMHPAHQARPTTHPRRRPPDPGSGRNSPPCGPGP